MFGSGEPCFARIVVGEHRFDARMRERWPCIERDDFRVRAIGAQKDGVQLIRHVPIGGVSGPGL